MTHPALDATLAHDELGEAELEITGRLMEASNATFLTEVRTPSGSTSSWVYKPTEGERPLWDFPHRTLGLREVAAYEVSRIGGFDCVPVTVFAEGPMGPGSLQAWVESEPDAVAELVDLVPTTAVPSQGWFSCVEGIGADDRPVSVIHADDPRLRMLAVFDVLINNADRKGGHILASEGRVFGVDHGVSFHTDHKLRTLLWGWAGSTLHDVELEAVEKARDEAPEQLTALLDELEIAALVRRADLLLNRRRLPRPRGQWPSIPWPPF
ncbi:SCO1664 family protein [Microlunatus capsulatus]|uniref:Repeat protein (TIGR03843 family) n=1 Tax=Microlunatus capsulatus TaxID=99117 RepID=A0ABS4ZD99_9ACTN|nr:SCO1664 family protein [Microlunatus capsulatus]MBP2418707.1 putative repeat protein (TIGR03843 family) [Microlunatus capsulatus]